MLFNGFVVNTCFYIASLFLVLPVLHPFIWLAAGVAIGALVVLLINTARGQRTNNRVVNTNPATAKNNQPDLLNRKNRQARLFEFSLQEADQAFYWLNNAGDFMYGNPAGYKMLGIDPKRKHRYNLKDVVAHWTPERWQQMWQQTKAQHSLFFELEVLSANGGTAPIEAHQSYIEFEGEAFIVGIVRDITERKQAEQKLKESQQRLQLALEGAREGIWDWYADRDELLVNDYHAKLLGNYNKEEVGGSLAEFLKKMHPDDVAHTYANLIAHLKNETDHYESEYRLKTKEGEWKWLLVHGKVVERDANGKALRAIGTHVDINTRKLAEQALEESNRKIQEINRQLEQNLDRQILISGISGAFSNLANFEYNIHQVLSILGAHTEVSRVFIGRINEEAQIMHLNYEWCRPGVPSSQEMFANFDMTQMPSWKEYVYEIGMICVEDRDVDTTPDLQAVMERNNVRSALNIPLFVKAKLYGFIGFDVVDPPRKWSQTEIELLKTIGNVLSNVFERKLIHENLKVAKEQAEQSNERLRLAVEAARLGLWDWDYTTGETYYSPEYFRLLGYEVNEFKPTYTHWLELIHADDRTRILDIRKEQFKDKLSEGTIEYRLRTKSGAYIWVQDKSRSVYNQELELPDRMIGIVMDVTAQKDNQGQIIATILETEDKERKRIAEELHDGLGQTLTTAALNLNSLRKMSQQLDDKDQQKLNNAITFLNQTISELRNISHNLMPKAIEDFGYAPAVENMLTAIREASGIDIDFINNHHEQRLPATTELNLFRITQEALNNSLKHAAPTQITVQLMNYEDVVILTIEDDGKGFDKSLANDINSSFGLNSMRNRASAMGGSIHLESNPNRGTLITVEVPKKKELTL